MLKHWKHWLFLILSLLPIPVIEQPTVAHLWVENKPHTIHIRWGREVLAWKRENLRGFERTSRPKIMKHEFDHGRSVFWFQELAMVDVGAMPAKEWPLLEKWMNQKKIRVLIWRKSDRKLRDWKNLEQKLPLWIEQVWWISPTGTPEPSRWKGKITRRRWTTGPQFWARHSPVTRPAPSPANH